MTTIYVKAYVKEDGTHVKAHTREIEGATYKERSQSIQDLSYAIINSIGDFTKSTKEEVEMYEELLRKNKEELGDHCTATINSDADDMGSICSMVRNLDAIAKDLTTLKTIRKKAGMNEEEPSIFGQPFQIASNSTKGLLANNDNNKKSSPILEEIPEDIKNKARELSDNNKTMVNNPIWKNKATDTSNFSYKLKTGKEPPKTLREFNEELESIHKHARKRAIDNGKNTIFDGMNDEKKFKARYMFSNIKVEPLDLFGKVELDNDIKNRYSKFHSLSINEKKILAKDITNKIIDSSKVFNDKNRPEVIFSDDRYIMGGYDTNKNQIIINPDFLRGKTQGNPYDMFDTLSEEVAHAAMNELYKGLSEDDHSDHAERIRFYKNTADVYAGHQQDNSLYENNPNEVNAKFNAKELYKENRKDLKYEKRSIWQELKDNAHDASNYWVYQAYGDLIENPIVNPIKNHIDKKKTPPNSCKVNNDNDDFWNI